ncbi:hypothetical protein BU24DRAFT_461967 [Aaosphaeria arxii CBS 175.79]|uniref:Probable double zinc ribbon domain-containing protein n=1 Tax=Aaosphaeria arxii CBS 175.79 TaxID=1450172 RepID=A0A6A5XR15_9PLEO|nr:uncharacterized protein BU24DRAFT_461967 [Aaosphaeria arxii CBS 175.79]KAF2015735.1 hypothetical protein BU24DRAFT_461967 [Aaosphaeria arxii CBS 175.79]
MSLGSDLTGMGHSDTGANSLQLRPGKHPIGAVACRCPHRPCEDCRFSGSLRYFMPITDPLSIPRVDRHHSTTGDRMSEIPYGIVCKTCGLSWRAEEVRRARRVPSLKETFRDLQKNRLHPRGGRLQKSQSMLTLNASPKLVVEDSSSPIVRSTSIRLAGRKCTCGSVSSEDTFCFRIVTENELGNSLESSARYYREPSRVTDEELRAKGHHNSVLCIRNVVHPNPLRRNPVEL